MSVENNYTIAIDTPIDWPKNLAPVFSTNEEQNQKQSQLVSRRNFSCALSRLQVIARNSDWFIGCFASVFDWPGYFGFGSSAGICKRSKIDLSANATVLDAFGRPQSQVAFHTVIFGYLLRSLHP